MDQRARRQRQAGDSGWKAQIILDLGTRPGLTSRRAGFEHHDIQAFRGRIDAGGKTRRPCPHYDDVPHAVIIDLLIHTQGRSDFFVAGIFQHHCAVTDHHRKIFDADVKALEQLAHRRIAVDVQVHIRIAVAREELLQTQRARRAGGPEQHDVAAARGHQRHTPQNESTHEQFAELRVGLHDGAQVGIVDRKNFTAFAHAHAHHRTDAAQGAHVSGKTSRTVNHDQALPRQGGLNHFNTSRQNHEHGQPIAGLSQDLAVFGLQLVAMGAQARNLHGVQARKHLCAAPRIR